MTSRTPSHSPTGASPTVADSVPNAPASASLSPPTGPKPPAANLPAELSTRGRPLASGSIRLRVLGVEPVIRLAGLAFRAAIRHGVGRIVDSFSASERAAERRRSRAERTVRELVDRLGGLKGVWVKAGQFASLRHDLLPAGSAAALAELQSRVPPLPFALVREVVERELGAPLEDRFLDFDPQPLGAASIAQVHRASLPSGEQVAVKVQYPWVRAALPADLAVLRVVLRVGAALTGRRLPDLDSVLREFRSGLLEELDFEREARVAREIAENLGDDPQIAVPEVLPELSTPRVLSMSYRDAIPISDVAGLDARGVSRAAVLEVLARAYAKQVFVDGLFHADPHPGNLFVLDEPGAREKPRVLFVDFGLSKRLSKELRADLRHGIYALLQSDLDAFLERMDAMGMIAPGAHAGVREAVAAMFERVRESGGALGVQGQAILALKDEAKDLLRNTDGLQLPNDLLLYARTLSYLFALGEQLAPEVDLMKISTPYLLRFLAERD